MSSERWRRIKELVDAALDLDPAARDAYLDARCPDAELRAEVESLLAHDAPDFLARPAAAGMLGEAREAPAPAAFAGQRISHYRIERPLGRGGMGEVYLARDQELDRHVALKLLGEDLERDPAAAQRFFREARSAAALDHPYICKIFEIGQQADRPFIAMEYVTGETLRDALGATSLPLDEALRIAAEIAEALEAAHAAHIVHRDLKPSNIMLAVGGHVKVLDFGLAKRIAPSAQDQFETASRHTATGMTLGTLAHMAPEQLRGQAVDARADIFAFGILLFEMLTGRHPFERATPMDTAAAILNDEAPPPSRYRPDCPTMLDGLVARMLAKEADDRHTDAAEVRTELLRGAAAARGAHEPAAAPGPVAAAPTARSRMALPHSVAGRFGIALTAIAVLAGTAWMLRSLPPGTLMSRPPPSIAVLPLTRLGNDADDDAFAMGVSLAAAERLRRIGLRVATLDATLPFHGDGRPAAALAQAIGVDWVVTGSFRTDPDLNIEVRTVLTSAAGVEEWSERLTEPWEGLLDIQSRIAVAVARAITGDLSEDQIRSLSMRESSDDGAYEDYLNGLDLLMRGNEVDTESALAYFGQAVADDPDFSRALAAEGGTLVLLYDAGWKGPEALGIAVERVDRALALDPSNSWARRAATFAGFYRGRAAECILHAVEAAEHGGPYDTGAILAAGLGYALGGLIDEAIPLIDRATELEPTNEVALRFRIVGYLWRGRLERAIEAGKEYLALFPEHLEVSTLLGLAHHALGNEADAEAHYGRAVELARQTASTGGTGAFLYAGMFFAQRGEEQRAAELWDEGDRQVRLQMAAGATDNPGARVNLAIFGLLLGRAAAAPAGLVSAGEYVPYKLVALAAAHAFQGDAEAAVEVLDVALQTGLVDPSWRFYVGLASPELLDTAAFQAFADRYEARVSELRELL